MNNLTIIPYSPQLHDKLRDFMFAQYPGRSKEYILWWLNCIKQNNSNVWEKQNIVICDDDIVGCMTLMPHNIIVDGKNMEIYFEANTIVSPARRGLGVGKMLYEKLAGNKNRCTIGMTNIAYEIQSSQFNDNVNLDPVKVYLTINKWLPLAIYNRILKRKNSKIDYPQNIKLRSLTYVKFNSFEEIPFPENGKWSSDSIEVGRDKKWLECRFNKIWRASTYAKYLIKQSNECVGYVILRKSNMYGFDHIAIVDYRCTHIDIEKSVFSVANHIAKNNHIGFTMCLTSRYYGMLGLYPLRIMLPKKIKGLAGPEIKEGKIFFTSADSDLDFVYYE